MTTPHKITKENPPQFPCWLWELRSDIPEGGWWDRLLREPDAEQGRRFTHWHPDQLAAPSTQPGESTIDQVCNIPPGSFAKHLENQAAAGGPEAYAMRLSDHDQSGMLIGGWHLCDKCHAVVSNGKACARCAELVKPAPSATAMPAPSKEAMEALTEIVSGREQTMKERAAIIDRHFAPLRDQYAQVKLAVLGAIEVASKYAASGNYEEADLVKQDFADEETIAVFEKLRADANEAKALREENERLKSEINISQSVKADLISRNIELITERDALRDRLARLEAERIEWNKIYRPMYGHDWDSRNKGTKGF